MSRRPIWKGRILDLGLETVTLPNGHVATLEIVRHPGAAAIVPLHADGSVTLIHQYRHAGGGMIYEIPAGLLEPGEDPAAGAARELAEETGLRAGRVEALGVIHTTPGFTDERIWLFMATELQTGQPALEEDECIQPVRLPLAAALALIDEGSLSDGKTICALMMLDRRLRQTTTALS